MLLRTRIILFVFATLAVVAGLLIGVGVVRDGEANQRARDLELDRLGVAWRLAVTEAAIRIDQELIRLTTDPALLRAVAAGQRGALAERMSVHAGGSNPVVDVNLFGMDGALLYATDPAFDAPPLLTKPLLEPVLAGRGRVRGVRLLDGGQQSARTRLVAAAPVYGTTLEGGGRVIGAAVAAVDLSRALDILRDNTGGRVFAVGRDGTLLDGGGDPLWPLVKPLVVLDGRGLLTLDAVGRRYALASLPVADLAGGRAATVLVATDVTAMLAEQRLWSIAHGAAVLLLLLGALALLYGYLLRNFAVLDEAVRALQAISQGRAMGYVELPTGNDEIGRIGGAVTVFRGVMRELERTAGQRDRRLRRQQRFIRRQMETLAVTLEEDARQSLLDELRQIEADAQDAASPQSKGVGDELGLLALGFSRLATRVSTQQVQLTQMVRDLRDALADKRRLISLQQELEIARTMQLSILPQAFPESSALDIAARMIPAKEVGGDFYDVFPVGEDRLGLVIADVSGKGIPAAFFMLIARTMLRAVAESGVGPGETLRRVNTLLAAENEQMMFVTVFYAELDTRSGALCFANGGHNPPLRVTAAGAVSVLERSAGIALAVMPDMPFAERRIALAPGDRVILFTDGVTEAFDANGAMYGDDRLAAAVGGPEDAPARASLDGLLADVARFADGAPQSDDITVLVLRWCGAMGAAAG